MKRIVALTAVSLFTLISFGQQALVLKIVKGADAPNNEQFQHYFLEVANNYGYNEDIQFSMHNTSCENINSSDQVSFSRSLYNKSRTSQITSIYVTKNSKGLIYLKLQRPSADPAVDMGKWSCMTIQATAKDGTVYSNVITISSYIPNPNTNN